MFDEFWSCQFEPQDESLDSTDKTSDVILKIVKTTLYNNLETYLIKKVGMINLATSTDDVDHQTQTNGAPIALRGMVTLRPLARLV